MPTPCKRPRYWGRGGAGMMFGCPDDQTVLLLLRAEWVEQGGSWGVPGGGIGEGFFSTPMRPIDDLDVFFQKAVAEVVEECSELPPGFGPEGVVGRTTYGDCGFRYVTFLSTVTVEQKRRWKLESLDGETDEFLWVPRDEVQIGRRIRGRPLHFGVEFSIGEGALETLLDRPTTTSARRTRRTADTRRMR